MIELDQLLNVLTGNQRPSQEQTDRFLLWADGVMNSNPEGCNQHTGPDCDVHIVPSHYTKESPLYVGGKNHVAGDVLSHDLFQLISPKAKSRFVESAPTRQNDGQTAIGKDHAKHVADAVEKVAGRSGLAPLHKVREELSKRGITSRQDQDAAIHAARGDTVTASYLEGRHGLSPEEVAASIKDESTGGRIGHLELKQTENRFDEFLLCAERMMLTGA
jgi:hypothetical protein